jgi:hypothetical protein
MKNINITQIDVLNDKHFCTVFIKYTNTSPTEFLKNKGYIVNKKLSEEAYE